MSRPVLIVTGSSRGIGAATARLAGRSGYDVVVNYAASGEAAEAVAADVTAAGGRSICVQGDMSREADILDLFERTDAAFGRLDALVNNAGTTGPIGRLSDLNVKDLEEVLRLNVIGTLLASREAVRRMSTSLGGKGGSIVNLSSRAAALGGAGEWLHYAASKGAIESFTLGLAREVGGEGIRVNAVAPGLIATEIHSAAGGSDRLETHRENVPQNRIGTVEEVAATILWLLSDAASYVTGASVPVSGGR